MNENTGGVCPSTGQDHGQRSGATLVAGSPADAFFAEFRAATVGVRFAALRNDIEELVRVAAAFRAGERAASSYLLARGWAPAAAGKAGRTLALAAGDWLLAEDYDDQHAALLARLRQAWEMV